MRLVFKGEYLMMTQGVVYCVTNAQNYLEAALISALALRHLEPKLPITIISNHPFLKDLSLSRHHVSVKFLDASEVLDTSIFVSRYLKTCLGRWSPYSETLFLDADILPRQPIGQLWHYLEQADFAMAADRLPTVAMCDHIAQAEKTYTLQRVPADSTQFNSGVMLWRKNTVTQQLFDQWQQEWQIFQKQDQLALVRAIHETGISIAKLPRTYNISPIDAEPLLQEGKQVHLLHCWGGMVASGEFRQIARSYYPEVIEQVNDLIGALIH